MSKQITIVEIKETIAQIDSLIANHKDVVVQRLLEDSKQRLENMQWQCENNIQQPEFCWNCLEANTMCDCHMRTSAEDFDDEEDLDDFLDEVLDW